MMCEVLAYHASYSSSCKESFPTRLLKWGEKTHIHTYKHKRKHKPSRRSLEEGFTKMYNSMSDTKQDRRLLL